MRVKWTIVVVALCVVVAVAAVAYAAGKASDVPEVIRAQRFELVNEEGEVRAVLALAPDLGAILKLTGRSGTRVWLSGQYGVHLYDESGNRRADLSHMGLRVHMPIRAWAEREEAWWEAWEARPEHVPDTIADSLKRGRWEGRGDQWATLGFFYGGTHGPYLGPHVSLSDSTADRGELCLALDDAGVPYITFVDAAQDPSNVLTVSLSEEGRLTVYGTPPQETEEEEGEDADSADDRADEEATRPAATEDAESAEE